jgi:hypothetical protein
LQAILFDDRKGIPIEKKAFDSLTLHPTVDMCGIFAAHRTNETSQGIFSLDVLQVLQDLLKDVRGHCLCATSARM